MTVIYTCHCGVSYDEERFQKVIENRACSCSRGIDQFERIEIVPSNIATGGIEE